MRSLCVFACVVVAVVAQEYETYEQDPQLLEYSYPVWYSEPHDRLRRQLSVDKKTGDVTLSGGIGNNGRAFGTVGSRGDALFGKAGYQHTLFNDHRGKLDATGYGTRALSPYGNTNHLGGRLDWKNDRAFSTVDVSRQMHGPTTLTVAYVTRYTLPHETLLRIAEGSWKTLTRPRPPGYVGLRHTYYHSSNRIIPTAHPRAAHRPNDNLRMLVAWRL